MRFCDCFSRSCWVSQGPAQPHTGDSHHVLRVWGVERPRALSKASLPPSLPLPSQLLEHMARLRQELERERQERSSFQLECNRIQSYWEITRRELEERKAELRNRDREMEEAEERHQLEIKVGLEGCR